MTYEYVCTACSHEWEAEQPISAPPLKTCPNCNAEAAKRQISRGGGFILKGGGWYADGYGSPSSSSGSGSGSVETKKTETPKTESTSDKTSTPSTTTESTPAKAPEKTAEKSSDKKSSASAAV